ncbi:hypothetical protein CDD81_2431 [Ophiocordyceps australis]|uniref:Uncharacterized protein n=1 Tax=Ophiocordyceps australis TaxID=1399860 RepID=A0A2C5XY26_9HYPO|nr:hypothetical protein CDD81_2431 [Ophiocordyceps australis]
MEAQNAADSHHTRPALSPHSRRSSSELDGPARPKSPASSRLSPPPKDSRLKSEPAPDDSLTVRPDVAHDERDSDAETIVLPGKHGHSPSKVRKVRQEDRSDSEGQANARAKSRPKPGDSDPNNGTTTHDSPRNASSAAPAHLPSDNAKRKRSSLSANDKDRNSRSKDGPSGRLSSGPSSPRHEHAPSLHHHKSSHHQQSALQRASPSRRRRSDAARSSASDSEQNLIHIPTKTSSQTLLRDKIKVGERLLSHKRKASRGDSDDEADARKARRQRTASAGLEVARPSKDAKSASTKSTGDSHERSISPLPRHRRSISSQFPYLQNGFSAKKKRLPPPLQPTDYHSDDSSAGGSPLPRNSKLRSMASTPVATEKASPAKMGPHKKHLDAHGQTHLARACARGEYDAAKQRLTERPEDLNVADYAGNTPLQIAAINGCEDIVKLLIEAGCNLDCVNYDKDTPLLDAVDNGHLGVVKLLLGAGVNPRKANVNGEEPLDRVSDDTDNADEIRAALLEARRRAGERQRTSEDRHSHHDQHDARDVGLPDSPRRSPAAMAFASTGRRTGNVRSTKTRNDLLYMPLDEKTLRQAAGRGDEETVARILQVKEGYDDPEAMVAAARGGHDVVMELLLSLGSAANADPAPVPSLPAEFATPILAAIGQENLKAVQLFLRHENFDPTRRFRGETYYEIARRRQGPNWKEEEQLLKNAYDDYKRSHKDSSTKTKSPGLRRERDRDRPEKLTRREEAKEGTKGHSKHTHSSPVREGDHKKKTSHNRVSSPLEKRRPDVLANRGDDESQKRVASRPKKDAAINASDHENSPAPPQKPHKSRRTESDVTGMSSDGEAATKPRRKLVSKDKSKLSQKYHDRAKALRRDETVLSASSDGSSKRHRASETPDRPSDGDRDQSEGPVKRRRIDHDSASQEKRQKRTLSVDSRARKVGSSRENAGKLSVAVAKRERDDGSRDSQELGSARSSGGGVVEKSIHVKSEDFDMPLIDIEQSREDQRYASSRNGSDLDEQARKQDAEHDGASRREEQRKKQEAEDRKKKKKREEEEARKRREEEEARKRREEEEEARKRREEEEARKRREEEEARKRREEEEARKRQEEEEARRRQEEEEEKQRKEEEERVRKAEEERKRREEEEEAQKRKEQAERERREAEEAARREEAEKKRLEEEKKRKEEEELKRRQEEDRLHKEQLAREAAEQAQRLREEEERKEREARERAHREEMERKRAAREAEQKRIHEEQERARLDRLPPLVRWLQVCPNPKTAENANKFRHIMGVRYDTMRSEANGTTEGRELWVLNTDVAMLLGEKDLDLSRYTAWDREPVTPLAKTSMWRTQWMRHSLTPQSLWEIGMKLPNKYYGETSPYTMKGSRVRELKLEAWERFAAMDMFFVKALDFLSIVPNVAHLREVKIAVEYHELLESESDSHWKIPQKWKQDPGVERFLGFAPRFTYYVNGVMTGEDIPVKTQTSKLPFVEARVPRRGMTRAYPEDPDYEKLCREQGLEHLLVSRRTPVVANGVHASPTSQATADTTVEKATVNGLGHDLAQGATGQPGEEAPANGVGIDANGSQE